MPRQSWVALSAAGIIAVCCACGSAGPAAENDTRLSDRAAGFGLRVWPESFLDTPPSGDFTLAASEASGALELAVQVRGARELRALYLDLTYDAGRWHPLAAEGALGAPDARLELPWFGTTGRVEHGQVLIHPDATPGFSGDGVLLRLRFAAGPATAPPRRSAAVASAAPEVLWDREREAALRWMSGGPGDYDQNGEVNIADLTPLGLHYGYSGPTPLLSAVRIVDGDGNGEINIADITPIGIHYGERIDSYRIYIADTAAPAQGKGVSDCEVCLVDEVPGTTAVPRLNIALLSDYFPRQTAGDQHYLCYKVTNNTPGFSIVDAATGESEQLVVVPVADGEEGPPSEPVGATATAVPGIRVELNPPAEGGGGNEMDVLRCFQNCIYFLHFYGRTEPEQPIPGPGMDCVIVDPLQGGTKEPKSLRPVSQELDESITSTTLALSTSGPNAGGWFIENAPAVAAPQRVRVLCRAPGFDPLYLSFLFLPAAEDPPPLPVFTLGPNPAATGQVVTIDAQSSYTPVAGASIARYDYDFDGDGSADDSNATGVATYTYDAAGRVVVGVRAEDNQGRLSPFSRLDLLVLDANPPLVSISSPPDNASVPLGQPVSIAFTASDELGLARIEFASPGAGVSFNPPLLNPAGQTSFGGSSDSIFINPGLTGVSVQAISVNGLSGSDSINVNPTANQPPVAAGYADPNPATVSGGVLLDASSSFDPDGSIEWYRFDLNDDGTFDIVEDAASGGVTTHMFSVAGAYTITIQVEDNLGAVNANDCHFTLTVNP